MTNAIGNIPAGNEIWFSNAGMRIENGINRPVYSPGVTGHYLASDQANASNIPVLVFHSSYPVGEVHYTGPKSWGFSVRCVR